MVVYQAGDNPLPRMTQFTGVYLRLDAYISVFMLTWWYTYV